MTECIICQIIKVVGEEKDKMIISKIGNIKEVKEENVSEYKGTEAFLSWIKEKEHILESLREKEDEKKNTQED